MSYFTYILKCFDGTFYTGFTTDLNKRLSTHNSGNGAKYTRSRLPCELIYFETFSSKSDALKRESFIKKKMSRQDKLELVERGGYSGKVV